MVVVRRIYTTSKQEQLYTKAPSFWQVVGGKGTGGILVRESRELTSRIYEERLSSGALLEQLALVNQRLHFKRLTGSGPATGWISLRIGGKDLVVSARDKEIIHDVCQRESKLAKTDEAKQRCCGRTIVCVFAGRRCYLSILMCYLQRALLDREIDNVHLWDACTHN